MSRNDKKPMAAGFKRLFNSRHGKAVFPRAMKDEAQFEAFLPFVSLQADDKTILTRGGELIQCIRVDGLNSMTASDRDILLLKESVAELWRSRASGIQSMSTRSAAPSRRPSPLSRLADLPRKSMQPGRTLLRAAPCATRP